MILCGRLLSSADTPQATITYCPYPPYCAPRHSVADATTPGLPPRNPGGMPAAPHPARDGPVQGICARCAIGGQALISSIAANPLAAHRGGVRPGVHGPPRRVAKVLLTPAQGQRRHHPASPEPGSVRLSGGRHAAKRQRCAARPQGRGWIEVHDRAVTIKQAAALGRFAGHEVSAS
jgi:hypothetical protein